ncbi:MAG: alpha/beta hydrolase [Bacilli bacterium]|nr:alpha/beta hydrolase [Bacilli bacterium]
MSESKVISIVDDYGTTLRGLAWEVNNAKANVFIFQGMEEYSKRYDYVAKELNKNGYNVYGLDCYGQGLNAGDNLENLGIWPKHGFNKQIDAYDKFIRSKKKEGLKNYLYCFSMGSFMGQGYIQRYSENVDAVILSGSGGKNAAVPFGFCLAKIIVNKKNQYKKAKLLSKLMFGNFNDKIPDAKTPFDWISVDKANIDAYNADPRCGFGSRNVFCLEFLRGMNGLYQSKGLNGIRKDLPIYLMTGDQDPVTGYSKITFKLKKMYNKLGIDNVSTKVYKGYRHEVHNEKVIRDKVIKDIIAFFEA